MLVFFTSIAMIIFSSLIYYIEVGWCNSGLGFPDSDGLDRGSDSGGFGRNPSCPAGVGDGVCCSLYGHLDPIKMDSGFGRIR